MRSETEQFDIRLLGSFELRTGSETQTSLRSRRALAVLAYLLVQRQPVKRQALLELVWSDKTPDAARSNLSWVLTYLGNLLPDVIGRDGQTVWLANAETLTVDLWRLGGGDRGVLPEAGVFLDGFYLTESAEFELWLLSARETIQQTVLDVLHNAIDASGLTGDWELGTAYAQRLIDLDPWSESGTQRAMTLLARQEKYAAAATQYARLETLLAAELDTVPTPTTTALHRRIERISQQSRLHLPTQPTHFVERTAELLELVTLHRQPDTRLLTLHAIGGMGKTRMAIELGRALAADFLDGVHFISLVGATQLGERIANTLTQRDALDPITGSDLWQGVCAQLAQREMLLILDNFEPLIEQAAQLNRLIDAAPQLKIIVTSRLRLTIATETVHLLAGLPAGSALALFTQTTARIRSTLPLQPFEQAAAMEVCKLVDGMPLGIELAASWLRFVSAESVAQQLASDLDLLRSRERDRPDRQRTMRAVFDFSWQQLAPELRQTLLKLSIFVGSFSAEAAQEIIGATPDVLAALRKYALLQSSDRTYHLHPLLRQFLAEKSADSPNAQLQARFSHHYIEAINTLGQISHDGGDAKAAAQLLSDLDNIAAAWHWALAHAPQQLEEAAFLLRFVFADRGLDSWINTLTVAALDEIGDEPQFERLRLRLHLERCYFLYWSQGNLEAARTLMEACHQRLSALQAQAGEYREELAQSHTLLGWYYDYSVADPDRAETFYLAAVAQHRHLGNASLEANRLLDLGNVAFDRQQYDLAQQHWQRCADLAQQSGNELCAACAHYSVARIDIVQGALDVAQTQLEQTAPLLVHHHGLNESWHQAMGLIAVLRGDYACAEQRFAAQLAICQQVERSERIVEALCNLARCMRLQLKMRQAARYFRQARRLAERSDSAGLHAYIDRAEQLSAFSANEA